MSGRVQEGPRSPPDPINKYLFCREILYVLNYLFIVLPIVLPIVLRIELPINRLGGRYVIINDFIEDSNNSRLAQIRSR